MDSKISQLTRLQNLSGSEDIPIAVNDKNYRVRASDLTSYLASGNHNHSMSAVTGLETKLSEVDTAIAGKANTTHSHAIADVTGLQSALDTKADSSTVAAMVSDVMGGITQDNLNSIKEIADALKNNPDVVQVLTDGISLKADKTELSTGLSTKAETQHTHAIGDVTGLQSALDGKAAVAHTHTYVKGDVGLDQVDNTSDLAKPVSTAVQTALDGKSDNSHSHTKSEIGLGNVDNTSDADKPVSNAVQLSLDGKAAIDHDHTYTKANVGLDQVDNTSDVNKPISAATQAALDAKASHSEVDALALMVNEKAAALHTHSKSSIIGFENVDNTSDLDKPISTATQAALDGKVSTNYVDSQLQMKASTDDLAVKADKSYVDAGLAEKASNEALTNVVASTAAKSHAHDAVDISDLENYVQTRIVQATMPRFDVAQNATNDGVELTITFSRLNAYLLSNLAIKLEHKESSADDTTYVEDSFTPLTNGTYSYTLNVLGVGTGYNLTTKLSLINSQDLNNVLVVKENSITTL